MQKLIHIPVPGKNRNRSSIRGFPLLICLLLCLLWLNLPVYAEEAAGDQQSAPVVQAEAVQEAEAGDEPVVVEQTSDPSRQIHRADALSDEEIAEGWVLVDGFAYPPEEAAGQAGYQITSAKGYSPDEYLSKVTFRADVQPGIIEPVIIFFTNESTYREYYVELYASNRYETSVMMEPGAYRFTGGGPETDDFGVFDVISPKAFTVKYKEGLIVEPVIRSSGNIIQETVGIRTSEKSEREAEQQSFYEALGFEIPETESGAEETEIMPDRRELTWVDYLRISLILFALAIAAGIALLIYNKVRKDY